MGVKIAVRTYLSGTSLLGAAHLTSLARNAEQEKPQRALDELLSQHRIYVVAAVLSAVAALEGTINELFADAIDHPEGRAKELNAEARNRLAKGYTGGVERASVLEKFQMALLLAAREPFDKGLQPYQDAALLIKLRNALVHFEPGWVVTIGWNKQLEDFAKHLHMKFSENPLAGSGNPFFPDRCLGSGCAEWAVRATEAFLVDFHSKMSLTFPHGAVTRWLAGPPTS
jgi:hypothetical protein